MHLHLGVPLHITYYILVNLSLLLHYKVGLTLTKLLSLYAIRLAILDTRRTTYGGLNALMNVLTTF